MLFRSVLDGKSEDIRIHAFMVYATKQDQIVEVTPLFRCLVRIVSRATGAFGLDVSRLAEKSLPIADWHWAAGIRAPVPRFRIKQLVGSGCWSQFLQSFCHLKLPVKKVYRPRSHRCILASYPLCSRNPLLSTINTFAVPGPPMGRGRYAARRGSSKSPRNLSGEGVGALDG